MAFKAFLFGFNTLGLRFVDNDIKSLQQTLSFHNYSVTINDSQHSLNNSINEFCDSSYKEDTIIIYFSGHSLVHNHKYYLVIDNELENKFSTSTIHIANILTPLENCKAKNKLLILDCCRAASAHTYKPDWNNRLKILASSDVNETSKEIENKACSFFTWNLCSLLNQQDENLLLYRYTNLNSIFDLLCKSVVEFNERNSTIFPTPKLHGEQSIDFDIIIQKSGLDAYLLKIITCYKTCHEICFTPKAFCKLFKKKKTNQYILPNLYYADKSEVNNFSKTDDLIFYISEDNEHSNILVLGDSGSGKSSFCSYIFYRTAKLYLERSSLYIPVFFALDDLQKRGLLNSNILVIINELYDLKLDKSEFYSILKKNKFLFILDGFDELSDRADYNIIIENLNYIKRFYHTQSKVLLTCRTHYFANDQLINEVMLGDIDKGTDLLVKLESFNNHLICHLQEFTLPQIQSYVLHSDPNNYDKNIKIILSTYNLSDLAKKPLLLSLICETLPELGKSNEKINRAMLYDSYTKFWINREIDRKRSNITRGHKIEYMSSIAFYMWKGETTSMTENELNEYINSPLGAKTILTNASFYAADYDIRNCSFLNRDNVGSYKFMHRSFMEYFVALKCVTEINISEKKLPSWNVQWFDKEVADFICELIQSEKYQSKIPTLVNILSRTSSNVLLWNILHIISLIDEKIFIQLLGERYLLNLVQLAYKQQKNIVITRQYCRILAKFGKEQDAKQIIDRIVSIAQSDLKENQFNNKTYIRYYQGQKAACEALLNHLKSPKSKYDRMLHIHVLGQLGTVENIHKLQAILEGWNNELEIAAGNRLIETILGRHK